jgi:hypothetical protein
MVGVRQRPINRAKDGEGFTSFVGRFARPCARQGQRSLGSFAGGYAARQSEGRRGGEELATRTTLLTVFHKRHLSRGGEESPGGRSMSSLKVSRQRMDYQSLCAGSRSFRRSRFRYSALRGIEAGGGGGGGAGRPLWGASRGGGAVFGAGVSSRFPQPPAKPSRKTATKERRRTIIAGASISSRSG